MRDQFQQLKKIEIQGMCPQRTQVEFPATANNYGCWDGNNFWIGAANSRIYRMNLPTGITQFTGFGATGGTPLQLASDGTNIWVGDYDSKATWFKFRISPPAIINNGQLYPVGSGLGGIQGVLWDGSKIWFGAPNNVMRFNTSSDTVELTVNNQINVNGLSYYTQAGGQKYILAACMSGWSKINADTGTYVSYDNIDHDIGYRICNDGTYAYIAYFSNPGTVRKFLLSNGSLVASWNVGSYLNSITINDNFIWTVGDDHNVNITDTFGNHICVLTGIGRSDIVIGGGNAYSVDWGVSSSVSRIAVSELAQRVSGIEDGYTLRIFNNDGSEYSSIVNNSGANAYFTGLAPAGLYTLNYNGYVAAKKSFTSGFGPYNSLYII